MTSQINDERQEKLEKAKSLGIKGAHLCSDETLDKKIAEEEAIIVTDKKADEPRKPAPKMKVERIGVNERDQLLRDLEDQDPDCKYSYQPVGVSQRKLDAIGLEATDITLGEEVVCRTDKKSFLDVQAAKNAKNRQMMNAVEADSDIGIKSLTAQPKTGY